MYYAFWGQTWKRYDLLMNMLLIICTTDKTQKSVFHTQHEAFGQKVNKDVQPNASYRDLPVMVISLNFDDEKLLHYFFHILLEIHFHASCSVSELISRSKPVTTGTLVMGLFIYSLQKARRDHPERIQHISTFLDIKEW